MTAIVLDLSSRLQEPRGAGTCGMCAKHDGECYPHRIEWAARLLRAHRNAHAADLLTPSAETTAGLRDVLAVLSGITTECLSPSKRRVR